MFVAFTSIYYLWKCYTFFCLIDRQYLLIRNDKKILDVSHCLKPYLWTTKAEQFSFYYNFFPQASLPVHVVFSLCSLLTLVPVRSKMTWRLQSSGMWCCVAWWLSTDISVYPHDGDSRLLWKVLGYISIRLCSRFSQKTVIFTNDLVCTLNLIQEMLFVKTGSYIFHTWHKLKWTSTSESFQYPFMACLWTTLPFHLFTLPQQITLH